MNSLRTLNLLAHDEQKNRQRQHSASGLRWQCDIITGAVPDCFILHYCKL